MAPSAQESDQARGRGIDEFDLDVRITPLNAPSDETAGDAGLTLKVQTTGCCFQDE